MTPAKRIMDVVFALGLLILLLPLIAGIALTILLLDGRPVFYFSERMKSPNSSFLLWKFRTMQPSSKDQGVSGGDKANRITFSGRILRRSRLDELPQLVNILRGDMSFVGPRPPLPRYVEMFPDIYERVLRSRPGVTGMASLVFHRREEVLLADCATPEQTENVYCRRCIPRKARLDLIYARQPSLCADFYLMVATVFRGMSLHRRNRGRQ